MLAVLHEPFDKRTFQKVGLSLARAGHEVVSICPARETAPAARDGIRIVTIPMPESKRARLIALWRLVKLGRLEKADVYLAPEPESWVAALILKAMTGARVVFDMHEHAPTEFAKFFPRSAQALVEKMTAVAMRQFARITDHIILTRESFEEVWTGVKTPRSVVINTNHLQPMCVEVPEALRARFGGRPTIIHQGIFGDIRGSYQLLDAMKIVAREIPDICCIVLGEYLYGSLDDYKRAVEDAGLEGNFVFIPPVPFAEVPAYIAVARVGLILFQPGLLNHTLAMPHKLFDYMREATPAVVPDFAVEVRKIVRYADCGILVDVTRPEAIAEAVLRLLNDPAEARRLGENGRRAVENKYNWQADEARLLAVFSGFAH